MDGQGTRLDCGLQLISMSYRAVEMYMYVCMYLHAVVEVLISGFQHCYIRNEVLSQSEHRNQRALEPK